MRWVWRLFSLASGSTPDSRLAAFLFAVPSFDEYGLLHIEERFGLAVFHISTKCARFHVVLWRILFVDSGGHNPFELKAQVEVSRKMLLAMVEDIRVVLLRLASRTQTLRYYATENDELSTQVARETLELYFPLR